MPRRYRKAAKQGDSRAQNNLGWMYERGEGVVQDQAEAVRWYGSARCPHVRTPPAVGCGPHGRYGMAAQQGNDEATVNLATVNMQDWEFMI
jgi:TPR repeat protein